MRFGGNIFFPILVGNIQHNWNCFHFIIKSQDMSCHGIKTHFPINVYIQSWGKQPFEDKGFLKKITGFSDISTNMRILAW